MSVPQLQESERDLYRIVQVIIAIANKMNAAGVITLRANQATTVVTKDNSRGAVNVSLNDSILLTPATANAAAALATTYVPEITVVQGGFTINHANNAQADKTFYWAAR